jgi:ABC-type bacteriocin/lantibiotic exporter with double-glycine peptidase domain
LTQLDATECGAACLAMILNYYGYKIGVAGVREHCGVGRDGLSALTIVQAARTYGLRARAISLAHNDFRFVRLPAIVHWDFNHFLIAERWSPHTVEVVDPALGRRRVAASEFEACFTGVVIELEPGAHFTRQHAHSRLSLWTYLRSFLLWPGFIAQLLVASLLLQLLGLGLPVLTRLFVDQIIPGHLANLLPVIGLGLLVIVLAQGATALLRASLLIHLQARVDIQMQLGFFEHLLTLPYHFFQQRSSGDLLSRLASNITMRELLTSQLISTLLDGSTVLVYLVVLLTQSVPLTAIALTIGALQIVLLLTTTRAIHDLTRRDLIAQGKSQGYLTEVFLGIATVKAAGAEPRVLERWSNFFFDHLNASVPRDHLAAALSTVTTTLTILAPLLLLWVGTMQVLQGSMSVGTMLGLNALAVVFLTPLTSLAGSGQQLQRVRAHFERIADVVEAQREQDLQTVASPPRFQGQIELRQVHFRYTPQAPLVLRNLNICIQAGSKVALVGRTGSGKSTLGKLLLGLYLPTEGDIFYDGIALRSVDYRAVRRQFGVVLQESTLFQGSVRENIAWNDPDMPLEQVVKAAQVAAIHDDILRMPMGYETMVAESGNALSGGQKQRLAIARALACRPAMVLFDEATSHLDAITEQVVEQNLNALACTRVIIAHRLSTVCTADLILVLDDGAVVEQGTHQELMQGHSFYRRLVQSQVGEQEQVFPAL